MEDFWCYPNSSGKPWRNFQNGILETVSERIPEGFFFLNEALKKRMNTNLIVYIVEGISWMHRWKAHDAVIV